MKNELLGDQSCFRVMRASTAAWSTTGVLEASSACSRPLNQGGGTVRMRRHAAATADDHRAVATLTGLELSTMMKITSTTETRARAAAAGTREPMVARSTAVEADTPVAGATSTVTAVRVIQFDRPAARFAAGLARTAFYRHPTARRIAKPSQSNAESAHRPMPFPVVLTLMRPTPLRRPHRRSLRGWLGMKAIEPAPVDTSAGHPHRRRPLQATTARTCDPSPIWMIPLCIVLKSVSLFDEDTSSVPIEVPRYFSAL